MQFWEKFALTTVQIALGFASCNFSVAVQFFLKSHSHPCDYLYKQAVKAAISSALPSLSWRLLTKQSCRFGKDRLSMLGTGKDLVICLCEQQ